MYNDTLPLELLVQSSPPPRSFSTVQLLCLIGIISYVLWLSSSSAPIPTNAQTAGRRSIFEPTFLLRIRFLTNAAKIMQHGYNEVKDSLYIVKRMDTDVTIVPPKYLDELRSSTTKELSSTHANIYNMTGRYTNLHGMLESDQFIRVIRDHLNPNINKFTKEIQEELDYAFQVDVPKCGGEWQQVEIHALILRIVSRVAARLMFGHPYCRDERWLAIAREHTLCVFATTLTLRMFPPFLHPIISLLLPQRWRIWHNIREARKFIYPLIEKFSSEEYQANNASGRPAPLLQWMIENSTEKESNWEDLVLRQLSVTIASVYTSSQAASHLVFDLATNPQYIDELRNEIKEAAEDPAAVDPNKLVKLDACLTETIRINPPLLNAPNRRAMVNVTLQDGTVIPKGALVGFPCHAVAMDPSLFNNPERYEPFRPENRTTSSVTPNKTRLAFGWGKQACPGRFFATKEIKLLVARMLREHDFKLLPGNKQWPRSFDVEDYRVLNPRAKLLMRRAE